MQCNDWSGAFGATQGTVEDFTGRGLADLREGIIRTPLPPTETFLDGACACAWGCWCQCAVLLQRAGAPLVGMRWPGPITPRSKS